MDSIQHGKQQAQAQLEQIERMMARIAHADTCTGEVCELDDRAILEGLGYVWNPGQQATDSQRGEYHDADEARQALWDHALSVEVRSGWVTPGAEMIPEEYSILLCTGGPAVRIIGRLSEHGEPTSAALQYQDWDTPWTDYPLTSDQLATLEAYAAVFTYD